MRVSSLKEKAIEEMLRGLASSRRQRSEIVVFADLSRFTTNSGGLMTYGLAAHGSQVRVFIPDEVFVDGPPSSPLMILRRNTLS